jgi:hypothetical protein
MSILTWRRTGTSLFHDRWHPNYENDPEFTLSMWQGYSRNEADLEWRTYLLDGEEVARVCLNHDFSSHERRPSALLIEKLEVRRNRRGERLGLAVVSDVEDECRFQEIYAGPTPSSWLWWEKNVSWPRCMCGDCGGQRHGFVVCRL